MSEAQTHAVAVFAPNVAVVHYDDKKGNTHSITAEGALFKGGAALKSLKTEALNTALIKAANGRFRPSSDILCAAFPSIGKAAEKLIGEPWRNKSTMHTLINAVRRAEPGKSGEFSVKQQEAKMLVRALEQLPAFKSEPTEEDTIDA